MGAGPEISVVVPTTGRLDVLRRALEGLEAQRIEPGRMEVVIVVDGGDPRALAFLEEWRRGTPHVVSVVATPRGGAAAARNAGITRAAGRVVLMLDDDVVAAPDHVARHLRHHTAADDVVVTGSLPMDILDAAPAHQRAARAWWESHDRARRDPAHRPTFRDFVTGNVSVPRARLLELGAFDPHFHGCGREDYELGYRLLRAGLRFVHEPAAVGTHLYRKPAPAWLRSWETFGRNDVLFARKHPEAAPEVMGLERLPRVPWLPALAAWGERAVVALNGRGGLLWRGAAWLVRASHYWRGVRAEARDSTELRGLLRARTGGRHGRAARRGAGGRDRPAGAPVSP
jgi:GT2 family glycosyltransferase